MSYTFIYISPAYNNSSFSKNLTGRTPSRHFYMIQPNAWSQFGEIGMFQVEKVRSPAPQKSGIGIKKDSPSIWLDLVSLGAVGCQLPRDRGAGKAVPPEECSRCTERSQAGFCIPNATFPRPSCIPALGFLNCLSSL